MAMRKDMAGKEYLGLRPCGAGEFLFYSVCLCGLIRCFFSYMPHIYVLCSTINLAPNCFCSTDNVEDSPDAHIPPFKWPVNKFSSHEDAFQQLYDVVTAYEPGQSNIDGGGFDIVTFDPKAGYMYVQFESLKNGFIDDLELALVGDDKDKNAVQVRSSSRLGYVSPYLLALYSHCNPSSCRRNPFTLSLVSPFLQVGLWCQRKKNQFFG